MDIMKLMNKRLAIISSILTPFFTPLQAFAEEISISAPKEGYNDLGKFITNIISLAFIVAVILVLLMLVWGAFEWITSGGDKEHVASARGRIINALIGLAILAVAFALFRFAGQFLGFDVGSPTQPFRFTIPSPR